MKRLVLTFVAFLALFATVQTTRADWVYELSSNGWIVARWDSGFDDGTFNPPPPPPKLPPQVPPGGGSILQLINGVWYLIFFSPIV
ncbi:MAG TPA: hypothetical protein PLN21_12375 [Gemmatales bacterium]|nr:hypothetical protein [Gemmatales bacterium]